MKITETCACGGSIVVEDSNRITSATTANRLKEWRIGHTCGSPAVFGFGPTLAPPTKGAK